MWAREIDISIGFALMAHSEYWNEEKKACRRHDKKTPCAVHPIWSAMTLLAEPAVPERTRRIGYQALLWHDIFEDTELKKVGRVLKSAPKAVQDLVKQMSFSSFKEERRKLWNRSDDVKFLKLYDKVSNLLDGTWMDDETWDGYVDHTLRLATEVAASFPKRDLNIVRIARVICRRRKGKVPRLHAGNAIDDGRPHGRPRGGWFVGSFMDRDSACHSTDVEVKFSRHSRPYVEAGSTANRTATSLSIVVSGSCIYKFRKKRGGHWKPVALSEPGAYVLWLPGVYHSLRVPAQCEMVVVRWPSPGQIDKIPGPNPWK
jgi:hypothetical protein